MKKVLVMCAALSLMACKQDMGEPSLPVTKVDILETIVQAEIEREDINSMMFRTQFITVYEDILSGKLPEDRMIFNMLVEYGQATPSAPGSIREETDESKLLLKQLAELRSSLDQVVDTKQDCSKKPTSYSCERFIRAAQPFLLDKAV